MSRLWEVQGEQRETAPPRKHGRPVDRATGEAGLGDQPAQQDEGRGSNSMDSKDEIGTPGAMELSLGAGLQEEAQEQVKLNRPHVRSLWESRAMSGDR